MNSEYWRVTVVDNNDNKFYAQTPTKFPSAELVQNWIGGEIENRGAVTLVDHPNRDQPIVFVTRNIFYVWVTGKVTA